MLCMIQLSTIFILHHVHENVAGKLTFYTLCYNSGPCPGMSRARGKWGLLFYSFVPCPKGAGAPEMNGNMPIYPEMSVLCLKFFRKNFLTPPSPYTRL